MEPIVLASSSLRRQEILQMLQIPFRVVLPSIDESRFDELPAHQIPEYLAIKKTESVVKSFFNQQAVPWVLGADTLVILDNKIYGKPKDPEEAKSFLHTFSNRTHEVVSAIALFNGKLNILDSKTSINKVTFKKMSDDEIENYVQTNEWHGVAGGYRLQGKGACYISHIEGNYSSIVGLPIFELYEILRTHNYIGL